MYVYIYIYMCVCMCVCVCVYTPSFFRALLWWRDFCNSRKLWVMTCRATQDGWVMVESSDKPWPTRRGNGKQHLYSCCENPMNMSSTKREKKIWHRKMNVPSHPRLEGVQYATGEEQREIANSSRKNEVARTKWKQCSVVDVSGGESKVRCCKEIILYRNLEY